MGPSAATRQARGPSAAARQARGPENGEICKIFTLLFSKFHCILIFKGPVGPRILFRGLKRVVEGP